MSSKFDAVQQELADQIMHELPEELAAVVTVGLHEGGDGLVLDYPKSLHGTADMQLLDGVVRRFGGAFVSRGKGKGSYFLVPRPRRRLPAELANEAFKQEQAKSAVPQAPQVSQPSQVSQTPQSDNCNKVTESLSNKVTQPNPNLAQPNATTQPPQQSTASPQVAKVDKVEKVEQVPKQPSPITQFSNNFCSVCEDSGDRCNSRTASGMAYRSLCLETLRVQTLQALSAGLEKLASRPVYKGAGKPQQTRELHVDGGVKWCWNQSRTYEQAWQEDNKDSKEYADLKAKLVAAKDAGKKGVFIGDFWVFLDGFGKDAILRKKTQDSTDNKGGSR